MNFQPQKSLQNQYLPHSESKSYQVNCIKSCSSRSFQQHQSTFQFLRNFQLHFNLIFSEELIQYSTFLHKYVDKLYNPPTHLVVTCFLTYLPIYITYSKGCCEASFHPSVHSFIHLIMVCLLRRAGERVEYRHGAMEKTIGRDGTHAKALQWWDRWMNWCFTFVWSSIRLVMVYLLWQGRELVKYTYI